MAGGIHLNALVDLFLGTSQVVMSGQNFLLNETQPRNSLLWEILKAHDMEDMIRGGDQITDQIILEEDSTYGAYNVLEPKSPRLANHLVETTVDWAFTDAFVTFSKHEKGINQAGMFNKGARAYVFKNIIKAKWSNLFISINKGMEKEFGAQPNNATMEAATPTGKRQPMSLFATIHEFGATAAQANPRATVPPGFTTVQRVSPTTYPLWSNPVEYYADGEAEIAPAGGGARWDGFEAFMSMYDRLKFEELAIRPEYGTPTRPEGFIITSKKGKKLYARAVALSNDYLRHGSDNPAYGTMINYDGVPVKWKEMMDTANVWKDAAGTGFAGENDDTLDPDGAATGNPEFEGPRFVWIVPKYYKKVVHSEHFLEEETPPAGVEQPYVRTVYFDCWHQNWCVSRQRAGGCVVPSADIDGYD